MLKNLLYKIKDHRWIIALLIIQALIFSWLHIYGLMKLDPEKYVFTGQFIPQNDQGLDMCDNCFYLGWGYKQAMDGHILLEDKFQGYDTRRNVFHFWWVAGGHFARIVGLDLITFNFLQRIFSGLLLSLVLYFFALDVFKSRRLAIFGVVFYVFSSFWLFPWPEGSVFIANSAEVILPLGNALLVLSLFLTYRFYHYRKGNIYALSFTLLMLEMDYPYGIIMYTSATGMYLLHLLFTKKYTFNYLLKTFLIICIPAFIVVGYNYYLVATDYRLVYCQANMPSPAFWKVIVGYLPFTALLPISIFITLKYFRSEWNTIRWYLFFLFISNLYLMRVPISIIPFQMEMVVGIQLPLSFFAVDLIRRIKIIRFQNLLAFIIFIITFTPNVQLTRAAMKTIDQSARPSYLKIEHYEGMQWLDKNARDDEQVLSMNYLATYIPMYTGCRIYNGEYILISGYWPERQAKFEEALNDSTGYIMLNFLKEERIDYILYCNKMRDENKGFLTQLAQKDKRLKTAVINERVSIIKFDWKANETK
jgi:hypothetical protein